MLRTIVSAALAGPLLLAATQADAYTMGTRGVGVLVPYVYHDGLGDTTAVGLVTADATSCPFSSGGATAAQARVHWTFFDVDSNPIKSGSFRMTHNDVHPFIWALEGGDSVKRRAGYLLFILDTDNDGQLSNGEGQWACLTAEAFHAFVPEKDVAFIPTWPVESYDFAGIASAPVNLAALNSSSLTTLSAAAPNLIVRFITRGDPPEVLDLRYSVGGGDSTRIVIWSADAIGDATYRVEVYDDEQNRRVIDMRLPNEELNVIEPAALPGFPSGFANGFIRLRPPVSAGDGDPDPDVCAPEAGTLPGTYTDSGCDGSGVLSFSLLHSPGLGARQTILNSRSLEPTI